MLSLLWKEKEISFSAGIKTNVVEFHVFIKIFFNGMRLILNSPHLQESKNFPTY